ncbi:radical SAM protein [Sunxiuqinia indica]|uniref:radical SAM protein n=1 Tax=Sunxiuqinia indica TaxID=2692584 RepID=UPI0013577534|nr:radical SAM protein [Sunxiuqinia indica]
MKRFIECLIPVTACNIKCSYCYVIQEGRRSGESAKFHYSPIHIANALSIERLGGQSLISITGSGETMIPKELPDIVTQILGQGHFVNITTNGTLTKRFQKLIELAKEDIERLHISFSFHYDELVKKNLLNDFFNNVKLCRDAGASILVQINLSDEYMPVWAKIKELVKKNTGALPQVALTRDESTYPFKIMTKGSNEEYIKVGNEMASPLFDFTLSNFNKKQPGFCYAGDWSAKLNLVTGEMTGCYGLGIHQNIFNDLSKPIKFEAIGKNCKFGYCFNSSHFLSLGNIPSQETPSYGKLRNREEAHWYSETMKKFLNEKLYDDNKQYSTIRQSYVNYKYSVIHFRRAVQNKIKSLL